MDLEVTDLVFFGPRVPFFAADALWAGVMHTSGHTVHSDALSTDL